MGANFLKLKQRELESSTIEKSNMNAKNLSIFVHKHILINLSIIILCLLGILNA